MKHSVTIIFFFPFSDESERNSPKPKNNLCDNQILVNREVDNDTLEVVENGDLNTSNGELMLSSKVFYIYLFIRMYSFNCIYSLRATGSYT